MTSPILSVTDLSVSFPSEAGTVNAVRGVNFDLLPGKTLGIVGESGSGKSVTSMAIMGLLPDYAKVAGSVEFDGVELLEKNDKQMSKIRGKDIGMIFQDPLSALTPVFDIGTQLVEAIQTHQKVSKRVALDQAAQLLELVGINEPKLRLKSFPHQFSGGMRQRVVIAIAIANNPKLLIADEPTTALDVTIQAQILDVIKVAQKETGAATIMITHDMGVVAETADDVMVMYAGRPVERAEVHDLFANPRMPYTVGLLGSTPRPDASSEDPLIPIEGNPPMLVNLEDKCQFAPRCPVATDECLHSEPKLLPLKSNQSQSTACIRSEHITDRKIDGQQMYPVPKLSADVLGDVPREERKIALAVKDLHKEFPLLKGALVKRRVGTVKAVNGISFEIREGECMAIVGESGCGKTTTLLEIMDLEPENGQVLLDGADANEFSAAQRREARKQLQIVFQDPMSSLNPRLTVREVIAEPLNSLGFDGDVDDRVIELMELVGLNADHLDRFPSHFSGGQRQRIGLARALATNPKVIVLDEPVSALDVSIQAGVINLLEDLKRKLGIAYLFVAHDLSVVRHLSDRVAVMYEGAFVEEGDTDEIFDNPQHEYTRKLLSAIPIPDPEVARRQKDSA
ncbi:ABC transporter ATP-binding protein [Corynebacterium pseudodiphtheriticum]|uniref:ABC transporter ATP-binding protein n=1 Tax=Corynebacterium TaxID=1716 RepID=UPI0020BE9DEC|nr:MULTISPECIES: ABC transporter ATP-binding protein [Corynebacterium]MDK8718261.1 ABC transporter ATP-binding protein [Corynebacterium pseudodiphtheriticum]MDK8761480.1 ABC transporter ATP-binding protein [Corynebacterium pseudodiphtheriticum]UQV56742.1 ABC transporter ATP-binding protein [Corynebacterium pseudodiphtheriticum]UQV58745.1 ABC transporter ATP-binding protein [Corynebacterium pseudodiphtheriticum]WKS31944.1 ABC transporter ATP-binding protein [Corynebacterium propinquum]